MKQQIEYYIREKDIAKISNKFKVLSEESRLKILQSLQFGEKSVSEIVEDTGLMQANVSKQLKILLDENMISLRTEGKHHFYSIADKQILEICKLICSNNP